MPRDTPLVSTNAIALKIPLSRLRKSKKPVDSRIKQCQAALAARQHLSGEGKDSLAPARFVVFQDEKSSICSVGIQATALGSPSRNMASMFVTGVTQARSTVILHVAMAELQSVQAFYRRIHDLLQRT